MGACRYFVNILCNLLLREPEGHLAEMASDLMAANNVQDEQDKWLAEAGHNIKKHAFFMKKALDNDNLREALKYCTAMLGELRTSLLTPQKYYELYMQASAELLHLEMAFADEVKRGKTYTELYELVQNAGNVLPRLYMLCSVGSVYIKSGEGPAKVILKDLVEMCKGVQHPTRGLFLRSYLAQISRDKLPDTGSKYEGEEGGNIADAVDFVVRNFTEMNKLWVRMQHQGAMRDKERREKERQQLQDLVGKNLVLLSQLEGMDLQMYQAQVLPRIMEQIVSCKDDIAQQYLMDCVIQVFPDEFHLQTLDVLLGACPDLQVGVKVHTIMGGLMNRLAKFAQSNPEAVMHFTKVDAFGKLCIATEKVAATRAEMPAAHVANLHMALLGFTAEVQPDKLEYVNIVLDGCCKVMEGKGQVADRAAEKELVGLLVAPLEKLGLREVLHMSAYPRLMGLLAPTTRQELSVTICRAMLKTETKMETATDMEQLFHLIHMLLKDQPGAQPPDDDEDFQEEQNLVARVIHLLSSPDVDSQMEVLTVARKHLLEGGPLRLRHTLRPLCFRALSLIRAVATSAEPKPSTGFQAVYKFLFQTVETLAEIAQQPEAAMQLLLQCALSASEIACQEQVAFQFMESAFELFEEYVSDSKAQIVAIQAIVGTLQRCYIFGSSNHDTLVAKVTAYSTKLLRKADQCRAICTCAQLHWQPERPQLEGIVYTPQSTSETRRQVGDRDGDEDEDNEDDDSSEGSGDPIRNGAAVLKTLKRALKTANAVQQQLSFSRKADNTEQAAALFVEILNTYLLFFSAGCPEITSKVLQDLVELVVNEVGSTEGDGNLDAALKAYHENTISHIRFQQEKEGHVGSLFSQLSI